MLELFDTVGLRRIEAGWMKVGAVRAAVREWNAAVNPVGAPAPAPDSKPTHATISFRKAKSNGPEDTREVPISSVTLRYLDEYVSSLKRLMSRLRLPFSDETPLFPNLGQGDSRGEAVQPGYFTLEFHLLAKAAGITVPCSPHTARHRYIVKELIRLILSHNIENTDDFRRALLDSKVFVTKLRQLTGHASEEGLKPYIQQAFEELANLKSVLRRVDAHRGVEALEAARERFWLSLDGAEDPMQAGIELAKAVEAYQSAVVVFSDR
jgi:integrase/recombinase XerD